MRRKSFLGTAGDWLVHLRGSRTLDGRQQPILLKHQNQQKQRQVVAGGRGVSGFNFPPPAKNL